MFFGDKQQSKLAALKILPCSVEVTWLLNAYRCPSTEICIPPQMFFNQLICNDEVSATEYSKFDNALVNPYTSVIICCLVKCVRSLIGFLKTNGQLFSRRIVTTVDVDPSTRH